jgi:hypothetical protein
MTRETDGYVYVVANAVAIAAVGQLHGAVEFREYPVIGSASVRARHQAVYLRERVLQKHAL